MGRIEPKREDIRATLCARCAVSLRNGVFFVSVPDPLEENEKITCDWCETAQAIGRYIVRLK